MSEHPLSAIAEINPSLPRHVHDSELVSFVRMTDVNEAGGIVTSADVSFGSVKLGFTRFAEGDVIFAKITPCMENGKGAFAIGLTSGIGCGSTEFHVLRAKGENCGGFIYQVAQSREFRQKAETSMSGSAGQQRVPSDFFKEHPVYIPTPPEQRRIAEILSTLDEAIEQTEALIAKHQQIKAGLMHDLFTRGVTPDGHLRPTREQAPDLYKESPLGWIPKEWGVVPLNNLAQFITSGSRGWAEYYSDIGPLFIRIGNLTRAHINFRWDSVVRVSLPKFTEGQRTAVMPNDILISITADLGIVAVADESLGEAYVNQHIALVRLIPNNLSSRFLGYFLTTAAVQKQFLRLNDSGAKAGLNLPAVGRILVVRPHKNSEATTMATMIDACEGNIESHKVELSKIHQQKHGLMHDLLTGRVRVPVVDAKEGVTNV